MKMLVFFNTRKSIETNTASSTNFTMISDQQTPLYGFRYHSAEFAKSPPKTEVSLPVTVHALQTGLLLMNPPAAVQPLPAGLCPVQARRGELRVEETTAVCDTTVRAASQLPLAQAWLGLGKFFHAQTRSRQESSLQSSWRRIYVWSVLSSLPNLQA